MKIKNTKGSAQVLLLIIVSIITILISLLLKGKTVAHEVEAVEVVEVGKPIVESPKEKIMEAFKDTPIMIEVARCESSFRQFDSDGTVIRGVVNNKDTGVFQVNETYHLKKSIELGHNIYTIDGNIAYAKYLYSKNGTRDWNASRECWSK